MCFLVPATRAASPAVEERRRDAGNGSVVCDGGIATGTSAADISSVLQLQEIIDHNKALVEHQQHLMSIIPKQLKVDSTVLHKAQTVEQRIRKEEAARRARELQAVKQSAAVELEATRQQLEARVEKQAAQLKMMGEEQVAYHKKRRQQITVRPMGCSGCLWVVSYLVWAGIPP